MAALPCGCSSHCTIDARRCKLRANHKAPLLNFQGFQKRLELTTKSQPSMSPKPIGLVFLLVHEGHYTDAHGVSAIVFRLNLAHARREGGKVQGS